MLNFEAFEMTGCLEVDATAGDLSENLAIADVGVSTWVWVGDVVKKTLDGGATWEP